MLSKAEITQAVMYRRKLIAKAGRAQKSLRVYQDSLAKDDPRQKTLSKMAMSILALSQRALWEMREYAALAEDVPESVLQNRFK